jgi:hypothetical protein
LIEKIQSLAPDKKIRNKTLKIKSEAQIWLSEYHARKAAEYQAEELYIEKNFLVENP